jgi:hypothetical protein
MVGNRLGGMPDSSLARGVVRVARVAPSESCLHHDGGGLASASSLAGVVPSDSRLHLNCGGYRLCFLLQLKLARAVSFVLPVLPMTVGDLRLGRFQECLWENDRRTVEVIARKPVKRHCSHGGWTRLALLRGWPQALVADPSHVSRCYTPQRFRAASVPCTTSISSS